ncbi:MAG: A1 family peptidase [Gammaproteobacteria bacterium]|nr:A1 family peptidase [Gammaproteobacteria bacterium]MBU2058973.1 A1 family peptidase [Gammaproteobacteria bacterium]MBU2175038.1 A1 family peptidase [Gammaproteobacteria bacterium]MBU2246721.1 A1 family peptidase [Gammaproteobacteria bacterium]MBU2345907.1 A1 family peptidase [Gammaproteobacteria bacterium]
MKTTILPISMAYAEGGYTAAVAVGSPEVRVNLLLDTGSSALAVRQSCYQPAQDQQVQLSADIQLMSYGAGGWAGSLVSTQLAVGHSSDQQLAAKAELTVIVDEPSHNFYQADGIWGLAYAELDSVYQAEQFLQQHQVSPALSWPWPELLRSSASLDTLRQQLENCPRRTVQPLFDALQQQNALKNSFALLTRRAVYHHSGNTATSEADKLDPLNQGLLVLGDAELCTDLYEEPLQSISLVHDKYYNTELLSIQLEGFAAFAVPALAPQDQAAYGSNSIFDSGSSFLILEQSCYQYLIQSFCSVNPLFGEQINKALDARNNMQGLPLEQLQLSDWPDILLTLRGSDCHQSDVILRLKSSEYWQLNAPTEGLAMFLLASQLAGWASQSILGLPVMNNKYCIFDRAADNGMGVIKVAKAR